MFDVSQIVVSHKQYHSSLAKRQPDRQLLYMVVLHSKNVKMVFCFFFLIILLLVCAQIGLEGLICYTGFVGITIVALR